jgi:hypothetical protein
LSARIFSREIRDFPAFLPRHVFDVQGSMQATVNVRLRNDPAGQAQDKSGAQIPLGLATSLC